MKLSKNPREKIILLTGKFSDKKRYVIFFIY